MLGELRKSHVGDDYFYRFPPTKKNVKLQKLDPDIHGCFGGGERWSARTGASTIKRIHRHCIKYLGKGLILNKEEGKFGSI